MKEVMTMEDSRIVDLYWARDEQAIPATVEKYGSYCTSIAGNILESREDAEECVNDTWLRAWNAMPPHRPGILSTFLGKITRNLSLNRYEKNRADKRGGGETLLVLDELAECVSGTDSTEQAADRRELVRAINAFLASLPPKKRRIFVCRYWYFDSVSAIAGRYGMTETHVSVTLHRLRTQLRDYLTERGFDI